MADTYHALTGTYEIDSTTTTDTTFAINPERQLAGISQQDAQADATYSTHNGLNAAAAMQYLVGDAATIGENKTEDQ